MMRIELLLCAFLIALLTALFMFPLVLRFANQNQIVDNPNERKLQRRPIPVLGGVVVFLGLLIALVVGVIHGECSSLYPIFLAIVILLCVGTIDDMKGLSALLRLVIEVGVVLMLILLNDVSINHFYGVFGVYEVFDEYAIPLTIFASVGIINAINLIDGVDGLSSGFGIMASIMFGLRFWWVGDFSMALLACVTTGALIPFFLHNVFGFSSKMFMGDGGTLVLGVIMSIFVISILDAESLSAQNAPREVGLIPFTLAVLSIPVFDTLRVMLMRILNGVSPFHPDKTHLHHIFIAIGCSHPGTTFLILSLNSLIVVGWFIAVLMGASVHQQLGIVIYSGVLGTFGLYAFIAWQVNHETRFLKVLRRLGRATHIQRTGVFCWLQHWVDETLLFRRK